MLEIWVSRSMRSTTISTVGFLSAGCRRSFRAAKSISSDLPEPWKCQIRPFFGCPATHALDDLVRAVVLLVAGDDLDAALLLVGGEGGEVGQEVEQRRAAAASRRPPCSICCRAEASGLGLDAPRPPELDRQADGAVAELLALGGDGEHVGHEQLGDVALVVVVDLERPVEPALARAHGRLGLDHDQRDAVDEQHQVGALLGGAGAEGVLGGDDVLVLARGRRSRSGGSVTCSPFSPKGIDRSPVSQAVNSSLALTRPSLRTPMTMARSL